MVLVSNVREINQNNSFNKEFIYEGTIYQTDINKVEISYKRDILC